MPPSTRTITTRLGQSAREQTGHVLARSDFAEAHRLHVRKADGQYGQRVTQCQKVGIGVAEKEKRGGDRVTRRQGDKT